MFHRRALMIAFSVWLTGIGVPAAFAAGAAKGPPAPVSGHWMIDQNGATTDVEASAGSFVVTSKDHRFVNSLRITVGPDADAACGTGTMRVLGRHMLLKRAHTWVVAAKDKSGFRPDKISIVESGKTIHAKLTMSFVGSLGGKHTTKQGGISGAQIEFSTKSLGECDLGFGYEASK